MSHPLVVALFPNPDAAAVAARALHAAGVTREQISIISRNHNEESTVAEDVGGTPGAEIEDSRTAAWLGELSGYLFAAIALVLPGIGSIVAAGPLAAGLGEAAGHAAGGVASALTGAGLTPERANALERAVEGGAILLGVHTTESQLEAVRSLLRSAGGADIETAQWLDSSTSPD
jgi:hypothetical protein